MTEKAEGERKRLIVEQRGKPKPLNDNGYWIIARRNPEKRHIVEAWEWIGSDVPPTDIDSATLLTEPTPRPKQIDNYTAGVVAEGMERRDEEKEARMREAMGLPPEENQEDSG